MNKTISVNWENFEILINRVVKQIKDSNYKFERIIAVGRGGLVPGTMLSHIFHVDMSVIMAKNFLYGDTRDRKWKTERKVEEKLILSQIAQINKLTGYFNMDEKIEVMSHNEKISNVLIVDDIVDSGLTIVRVKEYVKRMGYKYKVAVLINKKTGQTLVVPEFYGDQVSKNIWIKFAWEV